MTTLLETLIGNTAPAAAPAFDMNAYLATLSPEQRAQFLAAFQTSAVQSVCMPAPATAEVPLVVPSLTQVAASQAVPVTEIVAEPPTVTPEFVEALATEQKRERGRPPKSVVKVEIPAELADRLLAVLEKAVR